MSLITQGNNHVFICGMTRSGKTYFALHALTEVKEGVLFLNIQNTPTPQPFVKINANNIDFEQLLDELAADTKLDLRFPATWSTAEIMKIYAFLSRQLLRCGRFSEKKPIYIGFDECQTIDKDAVRDVRLLATRGLALGCRAVFISQRPALADLTFYTQASEHYIFQLGAGEREYFRGKGIDYDYCLEQWKRFGAHSYVYSDGFKLEGRRAINGKI